MRDLYNALASLALDEALRDAVISKARTKVVGSYARGPAVPSTATPTDKSTDIDLHWEVQPDYNALLDIDALFRARGLFLAAYEIAEMNRWGLARNFSGNMANIGTFLAEAGFTAGNVPARELVLIGAMIMDENVRSNIRSGIWDKKWFGFEENNPVDVEDMEVVQGRLRHAFPENLRADIEASEFASQSWSPNGCPGRQQLYQTMFHFNV
jgi:hypothetical protein